MAARLFALLAFLFLLATSREPPWADAHVVYDTTQALVNRLELSVQLPGDPWFFAQRNGHKYGVFPLGNVIAQIPSYLCFRALRPLRLFPETPLFNLTSHLSAALLMAGACVLFYRLCRRKGAPPGWAALLCLSLGLGTICFGYARVPYSEALQTIALLWVVSLTLDQAAALTDGGMVLLGVAAGILFNTKLVYAPVLLVCAGYLLYCRLRAAPASPAPIAKRASAAVVIVRACALGVLGFAPLCAVALWHNWLKTGSPWDSGYQMREGIFSGDLLPALYGFTLSTGKSAFLYSPPLVLGVLGARRAWQRDPRQTGLLLAVIAAVTLLNAKFRMWHADYCWGPRHLTVVNPLLLWLAWPWLPEALQRGRVRLRRAALAGLLVTALLVQLLGAAFYWDHFIRILIAVKDQTGAPGWFQEQLSHGHYIPQFSPLRGHLWMLDHFVRKDPDLDRDAPWRMLVIKHANLATQYKGLRLDWWALDWLGQDALPGGKGPGLGLLGLFTLGALAAGLGVRARWRWSPSARSRPTWGASAGPAPDPYDSGPPRSP